MESKTIPLTLPTETIIILDKIAEKEISSRNRILKIAILNYVKNYNGKQ